MQLLSQHLRSDLYTYRRVYKLDPVRSPTANYLIYRALRGVEGLGLGVGD